jgi:RNA polymerase sigma-70 factor (ECF subfamily)
MSADLTGAIEPSRTFPDRMNISGPSDDRSGDGPLTDDPKVDTTSGLVRRAQQGDRDAFGALYKEHHAAIYRLARFYLDRAAEDVVAETFLRAWKGLPRYKDTGAPFVSWLYGIARHIVGDELRRKNRTEPRETLPESAVVHNGEDRLVLASSIARLPDEQRRVIEMKYVIGMKNPEVAEIMGKSIGAVNALQWRGLKNLKEMLESSR